MTRTKAPTAMALGIPKKANITTKNMMMAIEVTAIQRKSYKQNNQIKI
jgi:hypothetical protein